MVLRGAVVTMDDERRVLDDGVVYVGDDGRIDAVRPGGTRAPAGYTGAPRVRTRGVAYPGLVDLHNHLGYNTLPLWRPPQWVYRDHNDWPDGDEYSLEVSWPGNVVMRAAPEAVLKYAQVKALVGGVTMLQGLPKHSRVVQGWLVRVADDETFGAGGDPVRVSIGLPSTDRLIQLGLWLAQPDTPAAFLPHTAEGPVGSSVHREYVQIAQAGCLQPGLVCIHATALTAADFAGLGAAGGAMVWSPTSNLLLYARTADVVAARAAGVTVCLGSDWSPSGTKNVLAELKVAALVNETWPAASRMSDAELCELVTTNPARALAPALRTPFGVLAEGAAADLAVFSDREPDRYRNLVTATERDVRLVVVDGRPQYGTAALMRSSRAVDAEPITVAGLRRRVVVRRPGTQDGEMTWAQVVADLERVRADPQAAWDDATTALAGWGGSLDDEGAPLLLSGDMPLGDLAVLGAATEPPPGVAVPPLDTLVHDRAFFAAIAEHHAAQPIPPLDGLEAYYR
jgi:cytosine/adenosine deaminase-related metal-dependent hydrolase